MRRTLILMILLSITGITFSQQTGLDKEQEIISKEKGRRNNRRGIYNYVDAKTAEVLRESKRYTDKEKADAIRQLELYTEEAKEEAISVSNEYTDQAKTEAIKESNTYTDQAKADANSYTDARLQESIGTEFTWDGNGVGLGTENVGSFKLAVEGKIGAHEIVLSTDGWADFVFESDYTLMPLIELDRYIQENKHLPEIPTTDEVEENGISVGEMDAKLLQKIEELTLYVIELKKEIDILKEKM